MIVGVPKEIKNNEYRVGLTPKSVDEITSIGQMFMLRIMQGLRNNQNYNPTYLIINSVELCCLCN